jgi:hypothetical protein
MNKENYLKIENTMSSSDKDLISSSKWNFEYTYPIDNHLSKIRLKGKNNLDF